MKTQKPESLVPGNHFSLLDINIGSVLHDISHPDHFFLLAGISFTDYAMIQIFEIENRMQGLIQQRHMGALITDFLHETSAIKKGAYADCSRLIVRKFGAISSWLKKHPKSYLGKIHQADLQLILQTIAHAETISRSQKQEFNII